MDIAIRQAGTVTILDLKGQLTRGSELDQATTKQLSGGSKQILLNMDGLTLINSSGITSLKTAQQAARNNGATIKLLHVEDKLLQVLKLAGMAGAFEIYKDETTAVHSFK